MTRTFVMGDPQGPFAKVLAVLDRHGALAAGERLAGDVVLISIGDHFDFDLRDPDSAGREGIRVLRWLASHPPDQVVVLLGNHDAARVMELVELDDAGFVRARTLARSLDDAALAPADRARALAELAAGLPQLPTPAMVARDYASFCTEQRALVIELLLAGRFHLALAGELADGRAALLSHAGITGRELALLAPDSLEPRALAARLDAALAAAVDRVRADWTAGRLPPLSLAPLHLAGIAGVEGGGLLYHRPTNPDRERAPAISRERPRRFDPRTLPRGLVQVAGHTGHAKCVFELGDWVSERARARAHGGIRTLRVDDAGVRYELGVAAPPPEPARAATADLILIDCELRRVALDDIELLSLRRVL